MNTDKLETLIAILKNLDSDSLDRIIAALRVELRDRDAADRVIAALQVELRDQDAPELFKEARDGVRYLRA